MKKGRPKTVIYAERKCNICNVVKPIDSFHNCKSYPGGHTYICIDCNKDVEVLKRFKRLKEGNVDTAMRSLERELKLVSCKQMIMSGSKIADILKKGGVK